MLSARLVHSLGTLRDQASKVHELRLDGNKKRQQLKKSLDFFPFCNRAVHIGALYEPSQIEESKNILSSTGEPFLTRAALLHTWCEKYWNIRKSQWCKYWNVYIWLTFFRFRNRTFLCSAMSRFLKFRISNVISIIQLLLNYNFKSKNAFFQSRPLYKFYSN